MHILLFILSIIGILALGLVAWYADKKRKVIAVKDLPLSEARLFERSIHAFIFEYREGFSHYEALVKANKVMINLYGENWPYTPYRTFFQEYNEIVKFASKLEELKAMHDDICCNEKSKIKDKNDLLCY